MSVYIPPQGTRARLITIGAPPLNPADRPSKIGGIDGYTKLILHCWGKDGCNHFLDSSLTPKAVTAYGNAQIDTDQYKFGNASGLFDGSGDYLLTADHIDWFLGVGKFTIDWWVRFATLPSSSFMCLIAQYENLNNNWAVDLHHDGTNYYWRFNVVSGGSLIIAVDKQTTISTNTWYHMAVVRNNNNFMIFQTGSQLGTTVTDSDAIPDIAGGLVIGTFDSGTGAYPRWLNAWVAEIRVTKGIARWISDFTPPDAPYTIGTIYDLDFQKYGYKKWWLEFGNQDVGAS